MPIISIAIFLAIGALLVPMIIAKMGGGKAQQTAGGF